jgi:hypothetical protein
MDDQAKKIEEIQVADYRDLLSKLADLAEGNADTFYAYVVETRDGGLIVVDVGRQLYLKTASPAGMLDHLIKLRRDGLIRNGEIVPELLGKYVAAYKESPETGTAPTIPDPMGPAPVQVLPQALLREPGLGRESSAQPVSGPKGLPLHKPVPIVSAGNKVGRNDPCPCGSGKKYKKCCGLK